MKEKDNVDVTENKTIVNGAPTEEADDADRDNPTASIGDEQIAVETNGSLESIDSTADESETVSIADDIDNGDSNGDNGGEKKPFFVRVKTKIVNSFNNAKDKTVGFFKGIGAKFKGVKERYKRDGSKK